MDRITLEVIGAALLTVAEEMGVALIHASYSTNIKERRDCSTAIFDARGQVIAQAEHIPMHLGSLLGTVQEILRRYPIPELHPGDMFIVNDLIGSRRCVRWFGQARAARNASGPMSPPLHIPAGRPLALATAAATVVIPLLWCLTSRGRLDVIAHFNAILHS